MENSAEKFYKTIHQLEHTAHSTQFFSDQMPDLQFEYQELLSSIDFLFQHSKLEEMFESYQTDLGQAVVDPSYQKVRSQWIKHATTNQIFHMPYYETKQYIIQSWRALDHPSQISNLVPLLDRQLAVIRKSYQQLCGKDQVTYQDILSYRFGLGLVNKFYPLFKDLLFEAKSFYSQYGQKAQQMDLAYNYLSLSQSQVLQVLQKVAAYFQRITGIQIQVQLHQGRDDLLQVHQHLVSIKLDQQFSFFILLDKLLHFLGDWYGTYYLDHKRIPSKDHGQDLFLSRMISQTIQCLPFTSPFVAYLIAQVVYPNQNKLVRQVTPYFHQDLLTAYLCPRRSPFLRENINPIQKLMIRLQSIQLEEEWLHGQVTSHNLAKRWDQLSMEWLGTKASQPQSGLLRMEAWCDFDMGKEFIDALAFFHVFHNEWIPDLFQPHRFYYREEKLTDRIQAWMPKYYGLTFVPEDLTDFYASCFSYFNWLPSYLDQLKAKHAKLGPLPGQSPLN